MTVNNNQIEGASLPLFDTHCHFDFAVFEAQFDEHLARAQQQGVQKIMLPAIGPQNWQRLDSLSQRHGAIHWALGYHPNFLTTKPLNLTPSLSKAFDQAKQKPLAIGECGLDGLTDIDARTQQVVLQSHLDIANELEMPVILHCRKAHNELLRTLKHTPVKAGGVLHGYSGSYELAMRFVDKGIKIGVGGVITYPRANKTRNAISALPNDCLVLETDAPDMPLNGFQGKPNHPKRLPLILNTVCDLKQTDTQTIASQFWQNSLELFSICE
ncbi:TatD family hydrolase [Vibrio sp. WXL103]|uniref:TatD family hydrolase n=1 Tax=Vibrio sp. WXL103 TaxID=3450710 RepID=UPI003EC65D47